MQHLKKSLFIGLVVWPFLVLQLLQANNGCLNCHKGIEDIRDPQSKMMQEIYKVAKKAGVPKNDCVVCHGGDPEATLKENAHSGTWPILKKTRVQKLFTLHREVPGSTNIPVGCVIPNRSSHNGTT